MACVVMGNGTIPLLVAEAPHLPCECLPELAEVLCPLLDICIRVFRKEVLWEAIILKVKRF